MFARITAAWRFVYERLHQAYGLDLRSLALFRIGLGVALLGDLFIRIPDMVAFYTDEGILPRGFLLGELLNPNRFSVYFMAGSLGMQVFWFVVAAVFALALLFGYRTKFVTIISWVLLISLQNRNHLVVQGGDDLLRMLLFWAMFLPLGACYSIDRALNTETDATLQPPKTIFSVSTVALLFQVLFVYSFSAALKTGTEWRYEGSALFYALQVDFLAKAFAHDLLQLPMDVLKFLTLSVFWFEALGPFLFLIPLWVGPVRVVAIILFLGMHLGFLSALELGLFPFYDFVSFLPFIPTWFWQKLIPVLQQAKGLAKPASALKIYYDGDCGFCKKLVFILRHFLLFDEGQALPAQSDLELNRELQALNSWIVVDGSGQHFHRFKAVICLIEHSMLAWPLACVLKWSPIQTFGAFAYNIVAYNRPLASGLVGFLTFRPVAIQRSVWVNALAAFFFAYIVVWNLAGVLPKKFSIPPSWLWIAQVSRIDQRWGMFSPYPLKEDGWYVIPARFNDGRTLDLLTGKPITYVKPFLASQLYANQFWRKYHENLAVGGLPIGYRMNYGKYLCRTWNSRPGVSTHNALKTFDIYFIKELSTPTGPAKPEKIQLWHHWCFEDLKPSVTQGKQPAGKQSPQQQAASKKAALKAISGSRPTGR